MTDQPGWITKAQAAARLGVDERTIERRARAGRINAKARPGFPTLYAVADVEILAQTSRQEVRTGVLTAVPPGPTNGNGAMAHQRTRIATFEELLIDVLHALRGALLKGPTGATGPTDGPTGPTAAYVDKTEALAIAGVSYGALRAAVQAGEVKQRGRRYRRQDLEAL